MFYEWTSNLGILKVRRPDLYNNPEWSCLNCQHEETFDHLWACDSHTQHVSDSFKRLINNLKCNIAQEISTLSKDRIYHKLAELKCWNSSGNSDDFTIFDFMKCWIPSELSDCLKLLGLSRTKASEIICKSLDQFIDDLYSLIWLS
jgi:hypothetical protein